MGFINPIEVVPRYLHYIYRPLHAYLRVGDFFIFQSEVKDMMTKEEFIKQKRERKTFLVIAEEEGDRITPFILMKL